jgi:molecular chaperone GrpE
MIDEQFTEQMLDQFRDWLRQTRDEVEQQSADPDAVSPAVEPVGLVRLVEEFTALRHDLKLQTRGARALEDESRRLLTGLQAALEALENPQETEPPPEESAARKLAESLAGLDEALDRGRLQIEKSARRLLDRPAGSLLAEYDRLYGQLSWLGRRLLAGHHARVRELLTGAMADDPLPVLQGMVEGYRLIQNRLARAMASERIARLDVVGRPVDPESMIVVDVVASSAIAPGCVVEEVRRGYTWDGRLLRCAEVRAAKAAGAGDSLSKGVENEQH